MLDLTLFGQRLLSLRKRAREKQPALAELLELSVSQISEIERGHKGTTLSSLKLLCQHYNVSADYLLGLTDDPTPYKRNPE